MEWSILKMQTWTKKHECWIFLIDKQIFICTIFNCGVIARSLRRSRRCASGAQSYDIYYIMRFLHRQLVIRNDKFLNFAEVSNCKLTICNQQSKSSIAAGKPHPEYFFFCYEPCAFNFRTICSRLHLYVRWRIRLARLCPGEIFNKIWIESGSHSFGRNMGLLAPANYLDGLELSQSSRPGSAGADADRHDLPGNIFGLDLPAIKKYLDASFGACVPESLRNPALHGNSHATAWVIPAIDVDRRLGYRGSTLPDFPESKKTDTLAERQHLSRINL